jgi:single-strand DNA-binding protein
MDLNKVILVGRVTADPQLKTIPSGQSVTTIAVATNRTWVDKAGAKQEQVEFTNVVMWGRTAEIASQFLTKGAMVLIEGRLQTRSWTDKQGQARKTTEVMCERMQLGPRAAAQGTWDSPSQGFGGASTRQATRTSNAPTGPSTAPGSSSMSKDLPPMEEIPTINLEEEGDIKPEEIPF